MGHEQHECGGAKQTAEERALVARILIGLRTRSDPRLPAPIDEARLDRDVVIAVLDPQYETSTRMRRSTLPSTTLSGAS